MSIDIRPENRRNAIAIPEPAVGNGIAQLVEWARAAEAAHQLSVRLVDTQFVPAAYRRKPEEATAAILAGAEVGLSPMASLRAFDNIQGTPAPKAITLRAIVQSIGHEIRIDSSSNTEAVVSGSRKGDSGWQTSTWTIDRARQMDLLGKDQWKKQPAAMLVARATAEVCRWVASDAIMGMPYSAEEIRDGGDDAFEARPAPRRVTAAEVLAARPISAQPAEAPQADASTEPTSGAPVGQPLDGPSGMTRAQQGMMHALFTKVGVTDRTDRLQYVNEVLAEKVGPDRKVTSSSELSKAEAGYVIDPLQAWAARLEPIDGEAGA